MTEPPRDWDKELADVDRAIAREGAASPARAPTVRPEATAPLVPRRAVALTWFLTAIGVLLAAALPFWPYEKACGTQLMFYLGAVGLAVLIGVWSATTSWRARRGLAHILSLMTVAWAAVLLAGAVLPRIRYAKVEQTWLCP